MPAAVGAGSALLTQFGERLVGRFFERRARQEQLRDADLIELEKAIFEVRDLATSYWPFPSGNPMLEGAIVGRMTFLSELAEELFASKSELLWNLQVAINAFDTACTGGEFGSPGRAADPGRCRDVEITAYRLVRLAKESRRKL